MRSGRFCFGGEDGCSYSLSVVAKGRLESKAEVGREAVLHDGMTLRTGCLLVWQVHNMDS
jgi:hypothetical protein